MRIFWRGNTEISEKGTSWGRAKAISENTPNMNGKKEGISETTPDVERARRTFRRQVIYRREEEFRFKSRGPLGGAMQGWLFFHVMGILKHVRFEGLVGFRCVLFLKLPDNGGVYFSLVVWQRQWVDDVQSFYYPGGAREPSFDCPSVPPWPMASLQWTTRNAEVNASRLGSRFQETRSGGFSCSVFTSVFFAFEEPPDFVASTKCESVLSAC